MTVSVHHSRRLAGLAADDSPPPSGGGADDRPAVVLLHGLSFDRRMWRPVTEALARLHPVCRSLSLDLPGHGESPGWSSYGMAELADGIHAAVTEAKLPPPVMVGHSLAAVIATVYAARYPTRGVVNVDQSLQVEPFARLAQSLAPRLRGPEFPAAWAIFHASMHTELLPAGAQELLAASGPPAQELVLGYWSDVLDREPDELDEWARSELGELRAKGLPYLVVCAEEPDPDYRRWLGAMLPQARVEAWPGSGHFPHLAHPDRFAERLAATAAWPAPA